jgi:membrane-associated phospholipid phosphatase
MMRLFYRSMTVPFSLRRGRFSLPRDAAALSPLDRLTLVYVAFTTGVVIAHLVGWRHGGLPRQLGGSMLVANGLLLVAAAIAPRARCTRSRGFIAEWYAAIVLVGLYAVVGLLNDPTTAPAPSFDAVVQGWDLRVFGEQVAYTWPRGMPSHWLAEFLSLCYLSFYAVGVGCPAVLWAIGRKAEARQAIFALLLTMFSCYAIFLLFPVAGPPYFWPWAEGPAWTGPFVQAARHVIDGGDSWGSAFPSSHVAGSVVALVFAFRGWRPLGWILLVPTLGILVAVVYLQIHYGIDAIAGLGMAALASFIAPRLCPLTLAEPQSTEM